MALTFWDHLKTADVLLFIWRKNHVADCFIKKTRQALKIPDRMPARRGKALRKKHN